jgi:hypothetical protein
MLRSNRAMVFRRIIAAAFVLVALAGVFVLLGYRPSIERSVANGREIAGQFDRGRAIILQYESHVHRRPRPNEADALLAAFAKGRYNVEWMGTPSNCNAESPAFKALQGSPYVLAAWRGQWMECYSPTLRLTTVVTSPDDYALLGAVAYDQWTIGAIVLTCLAAAALLWRRAGPNPA